MKPRVDTTAFTFDHSDLFRISGSGFQNCGRLLPLALLLASWPFSASAIARTVTIAPDGGAYPPVAVSSSIDCITSEDQEKQPSQDSNFPDSSDIDDSDGGLNEFGDTSTPNYQDTPLFSVTGLDAMTLRTPRILPNLLFTVHCFYCLHEHIRERAPPIPA